MSSHNGKKTILLVEDDSDDVGLIQEAQSPFAAYSTLFVVANASQAFAFLRRKGIYAQAPRPDLILLDIELPGKNGLEVLTEIKVDRLLKAIPVVMLLPTRDQQDMDHAYRRGASTCLAKSKSLNAYLAAIHRTWCR